MGVGEGGWGRAGGEWNHAVSRSGRLGPFRTRRPDDGLRKERPSATETKGKTVADLKWSESASAAPAEQPDNTVPIVRFRASGLMLGKVRAATANDDSDVWLGLICFVCVHVGHLRCFFLLKEKTTKWHGRVSAEGTFSGPLDKSLGREPTPKGERFTIRGLRVPGAEGGGGEGESRSKKLDAFQDYGQRWPEGAGRAGEEKSRAKSYRVRIEQGEESGESFPGAPLSLTL